MLVISDTNILIDIEVGGIISLFFQLSHDFCVPDILFSEELEEKHQHLCDMGLQVKELTSNSMIEAQNLIELHSTSKKAPSRNDCFALMLALQEKTRLLTGDKRLKKAAKEEGVEVNGIIWVIDLMIEESLLSLDGARVAYEKMEADGSRLPWKEIYRGLREREI